MTETTNRCPHAGLAFPFDRTDPLEMPAEFATLRAHDPVTTVTLPSGDQAWLVTRYEDVRAVLSDQRFSRNLNRQGAARMKTAIGFGNYGNPFADPPVHTRWRRLVARAFTPRQVEVIRPKVTAIVDRLVTAMLEAGPPLDLMSRFAYPLPIAVLCALLGVPEQDRERFRGWVDTMLSSEYGSQERTAAAVTLVDYAKNLAAAKRDEPAEDLLSALVAVVDEEDGRLSEDELFITVMTLLVAGYKTTAAEIGKGLLMLLRHPGQLAAIRADIGLVVTAVDEMLRFTPSGNGFGLARYATADVEIGGVLIPAGATVLCARHSGNHDDAHFRDAERFDVTRENAHQHLTFGVGPAYCFGAPVARMEMQEAFRQLLLRLPGLALAGEASWQADTAAQAPERVPVTWQAAPEGRCPR
jgi:cytochrome P450